jgi:hypothetical protein
MKKVGSFILVLLIFGCSQKFSKYADAAKSWEPEIQQTIWLRIQQFVAVTAGQNSPI